jgi:hypothetical protein
MMVLDRHPLGIDKSLVTWAGRPSVRGSRDLNP